MAQIRVGRKRSLAAVGLCLFAGSIYGSPMQQKPLRAAQRKVPYGHSRIEKQDWIHQIPSPADALHRPRESHIDSEKRKYHKNDFLWHVHADASIEHPDAVFHELRRKAKGESKRRRSSADKSSRPKTLRRKIAQADGNNSSASEEGNSNFVNADLPEDHVAENKTVVDFNVTAETQYNVSSVVDYGNRTNDTSTVVYTKSEQTNKTEEKLFRPTRIRAFLSEVEGGGEHLTAEQHKTLLQDIVRPALLSWSAALRVDPVTGNLTVDKEQLFDGVSCGPGLDSGLPSVPVPSDHLTVGVPDTDMILYVSLGFVEEAVVVSNSTNSTLLNETLANWTKAGVDGTALESLEGDSLRPSINGISTNATNATKAPKQTCAGDYLAASSFCSSDQNDRPTAAILHICIDPNFFDPRNLHRNVMTVMHELGHSLGFNAVSLAHFRRQDGSPITPRVKGDIPVQEVECTGPQHGRQFANLSLPSEEVLQFRTVRGGVRVAEIVTPSVLQVVRNHFGCQKLTGAELESGEFLPLSTNPGEISCIGDHWERRLFKNDLMNPIVDGLEFNPRISTLTLAFFADSGWYQVDLSRASLSANWGRGAGCAFVEETCISEDGQVPPSYEPFFCNNAPKIDSGGFATDIQGCTPDLSRKAACSIGQYEGELPPEYQYFHFTYGANVGGSDPLMDYCPVFSGFSNGRCSDPENEALIRVNRMEKFGTRNSRCLSGHVRTGKTALCLPIACVVEDRSFRIQVDGLWRTCEYKGQELASHTGDRVVCPDPIRVCPTFYCHRDCLGTNRICDFWIGKCVCKANMTAVDDEGDCVLEEEEKKTGTKVFYKPEGGNPDVPGEDSPLADYYVPTERSLKEDDDRFIAQGWKLSVVFVASFITIATIFWFWLRRRGRQDDEAGPTEDGDDDLVDRVVNPNKDKMLATVVVDLRMEEPNLPRYRDVLVERTSETDLSLTDTEGASSHIADLWPEAHVESSEEVLETELDRPPQQITRRRRIIPELMR